MTSDVSRPFIARWRSAVLMSNLPSSAKLCLLSLGEFANNDGTSCYPSLASLAQLASMNERSVRRCWDKEAEPGGWFTRRHKGTQQGWARFEYTLLIPKGADTESTRRTEGADTESIRGAEGVDIESGPLPVGADTESTRSLQRSGHCVQNVRTLSTEGVDTVSTDLAITQSLPREDITQQIDARFERRTFGEFWLAYPRKDAKAKAAEIWRRKNLDVVGDRIIADVAARLATDPQWSEVKFIPHATTYLNGRRWEDDWSQSATHRGPNTLPRETNGEAINAASMRRLGIAP